MTRIIDNDELSLDAALREVLPYSIRLDACVGYFNLRGWQSVRSALVPMVNKWEQREADSEEPTEPPVRLLIGMAVSPHELNRSHFEDGDPETDIGLAVEQAKEAVHQFAEQLVWGDISTEQSQGLRQLLDDLRRGVVRVKFAARGKLHAKLYVSHLEGKLAGHRGVVGSANWTASGMRHQGELSLEETDNQITEALAAWFEKRWDDQFSIDVSEDLIRVLEESWINERQPSPYLVHLRLAWELSRDARAGYTDIPAVLADKLLPHQASAVRVAVRILQRRGIAIIGDVVGLGKTLTGVAVAAATGQSVLVISPKNLVGMWEEHLMRYNVPGKVLSLSMAQKELPDMPPYRLIIVDESHNLRHRKRKAWVALREYIERSDSRVLLLTATMLNARHTDIGGQLALKLDEDEPLGIRPENLLDDLGAFEVARRTGGSLDTLAAFNLSENNQDWQRLLSGFLIRRTRKYLERTQGIPNPVTGRIEMRFTDGTIYHFPRRIPMPLEYSGGDEDPNDRVATEETFDAVAGLNYARYQLGNYLDEEIELADPKERALVEDLRNSVVSAAGFIRTTALKRLTSSAYAFITTIKRMRARNALLAYAVHNQLPVPIGTFDNQFLPEDSLEVDTDAFDVEEEKEHTWGIGWGPKEWAEVAKGMYQQLEEKNPSSLRWARPELFQQESILDLLDQDNEVLQELLDEFGLWNPKADTKLQALGELVDSLNDGEKVLVFSEYKDTVDYLNEHLKLWTTKKYGAVTGASSDPVRMARRFAPKANENLGGLPYGETELDVLLATDVLSEGQNLQDATIIVNWDLPWTIIKIIQRAGRIDRLGQESPTIKVLSFLPHAGVEHIIRLRERLLRRLKNAEQIFGGGERFFDDDDFTTDISGLFDGSAELSHDEGDVDSPSYALSIWEEATETNQAKAKLLPLQSSSTLAVSKLDPAGVLTYGQTDSGADLITLASQGTIQFLTPIDALKLTSTTPGTRAAPRLDNQLELMDASKKEMRGVVGKKNTVLLNQGLRRRLHKYLTKQSDRRNALVPLPEEQHAQVDALLKALTTSPLLESAKSEVGAILRSLRTLGDDGSQLDAILHMHQENKLVNVRSSESDKVRVITAMGFNPTSNDDSKGGDQ